MIPLHDTTKSRRIPFVNYAIIGSCGLVFFYELSLGPALDSFLGRWGVIPANVVSIQTSFSLKSMITLLTSIFLHGGWMHLLGNMLYLYIFGDNIEDRLGHGRYFIFFVLAGIGASLIEVWLRPASLIPMIGASGAIAGVMGAYFILYPRAKVLTMVPLFVFFPVFELPAFLFLGAWFVMQFLNGSLSLGVESGGGIAWWAHAGGFLVGAVLLGIFLLFKRR